MSKISSLLSLSARNSIATAFCSALDTQENTGSLVTQVCNVANKYLNGQEITKEDSDHICTTIAKQRGWKGAAIKTRCSEVRTVLRASADLPKAINQYSERAKKCDWHTSMKLARLINKGESVTRAVSQAFNTQSQSAVVSPQGRVAGALKSWFKIAKGDKREQIIKAAHILNIKLGVKLDA